MARNGCRAAQFLQRFGRVRRVRVDVMMRAQLGHKIFLIFAAADRDRLESHLIGVLDAEMSESAEPLNSDDIAGHRSAVAEGVERRDARAEQGGRFLEAERAGDGSQALGRRDHVLLIASVVNDARDLRALTDSEFSSPAGLADRAVASDPADADALADLPVRNSFAQRIDDAGDFVAGDARIDDPGEQALLGNHVAVTEAAGFHFHADSSGTWIGDGTFDNFDGAVGRSDLCNTHGFQMRRRPVTVAINLKLSQFFNRLAGAERGKVDSSPRKHWA